MATNLFPEEYKTAVSNASSAYAHISANGMSHSQVSTNASDISGGKGPGVKTDTVAGALIGGPTVVNSFIAPAAGTILAAGARVGTACAAGQSVLIDVKINATSCLTSTYTIVAGSGTTPVMGVIDTDHDNFVAGDLITVTWTEANAGGPTAADLFHTIAWRLT